MKERDSIYKEFNNEKDPLKKNEVHTRYKKHRNLILTLTRTSKKQHFANFFQEHQSNLKKTWEGIRDLINVSKKSGINISKIIHDNKTITDNEGISNTINNFFVNIGSSVEAKIPAGQKSFKNYLGNKIQNSIFSNPILLTKLKR